MQKKHVMIKTKAEPILTKTEILHDYFIGWQSRNLSLTGRKEVLTGKAKFGIFGDGKELPQLALAHFFKNGDWRSGYYRDQTLVLATGMTTLDEFFYQLYGTPDKKLNPSNGGRSFNNHFGTRLLDEDDNFVNQKTQKNTTSDISPTAGQMPRSLGLALASKLYRHYTPDIDSSKYSENGNEVTYVTIGDASTSEGHFFEILNSAGVLQVPLAVCIWDDGFGISVEKEKQTVKASISEALKGFEKKNNTNGIKIYTARGWNYPELIRMFKEGSELCRKFHTPVLFHVTELTQPLGHSTSGSHERYKSKDRLQWEKDNDCLLKMRQWIIESGIASVQECDEIEEKAYNEVKNTRKKTWEVHLGRINKQRNELLSIITNKSCSCKKDKVDKIEILANNLKRNKVPMRKDISSTTRQLLRHVCPDCPSRAKLQKELSLWLGNNRVENYEHYSSHMYSESEKSVLHQKYVNPVYAEKPEEVPGRLILRDNFDNILKKYPQAIIFGEDVGKIGGVNQTCEGLQENYGEHRVFDTGIRETSIIGKGIGLALRGFRPIAEIQYLDYLLYGLQTLSDDLATLHWRTAAGQAAPLIISSRGHRLEGIWHAGSPMGMIINALRGIYICVPRNMTQAAGMYNTLLEGIDPALLIEPLNGYRLREKYPKNLGEFKIPLGIPEIIAKGKDITVVSYGSSVRIALEAIRQLNEFGIEVELIDVQTLIPFDINETILDSIKKTNKIVFFDEDVPGGATAYMMQKVLEEQGGFRYLETGPRTLTARDHRPAYTSDGDYYSNPNSEDLFELVYTIMHGMHPEKYKNIF